MKVIFFLWILNKTHMLTTKLRIPTIYKPYLLPVGIFITIVVLSATLGKYGFDNIFVVRDQIANLTKENSNLEAKIELLNSLNDQKLTTQATAVLDAVPTSSSTLPALLALRTIASSHQVDLPSFSVLLSTGSKKSIGKTVEIKADLLGSRENVLETIKNIRGTTPLMRLENVSVAAREANVVKANLTIISIWSPLPVSLGKAETTVDKLKGDDEEVISKLIQLKKPEGGVVVPYPAVGKEDPFNY